ncbi:hypothetical protein GCM10009759_15710 [Kitasatospora saccharophila]|uniref:Uncharacterized protein n=1 Tax=Kitasatospora saccharophila TaxID=407973 RepID=A0ABN2WGC3_9ACTN
MAAGAEGTGTSSSGADPAPVASRTAAASAVPSTGQQQRPALLVGEQQLAHRPGVGGGGVHRGQAGRRAVRSGRAGGGSVEQRAAGRAEAGEAAPAAGAAGREEQVEQGGEDPVRAGSGLVGGAAARHGTPPERPPGGGISHTVGGAGRVVQPFAGVSPVGG